MSPSVARHVAKGIQSLPSPINLIWHSGEPLTIGIEKLSDLFREFVHLEHEDKVRHAIQTNGTLIDNRWCDFFRINKVAVSVSIDGPRWANTDRVDRRDSGVFNKTIQGIECLKEQQIPFNVICVVTEKSIDYPIELLEFFTDLGCESVGFNIVENDGAALVTQPKDSRARNFWRKLFSCWKDNPCIDIREFRNVLNWLQVYTQERSATSGRLSVDLIPTISSNGELRILSPELAEVSSEKYANFLVGNVVHEELSGLLDRSKEKSYYNDFKKGVSLCSETCEYFSYCRGGSASNKFAENGKLESTETAWCINSKKRLVDAVLDELLEEEL